MPELVGRRERWRGDTHLEVQVLRRRLLEEKEEMMEGTRRRVEASDTCRSQGDDDLDRWIDSMEVMDGWMDWATDKWSFSQQISWTPTDNHSLVQLPPNPMTPQILTNIWMMMMMMMMQRSEG